MRSLTRALPAFAVLALTPGAARGEPLEDFFQGGAPAPASQLAVSACEISVDLHGAIAELELKETIQNRTADAWGAGITIEGPAGGAMLGLAVDGVAATTVPADGAVEQVESPKVLGADPAIAIPLAAAPHGRPRFQISMQPIAAGATRVVAIRFAAPAAIRGSALHVELPSPAIACRGTLRVAPGPGARAGRATLDGAPLAHGAFVLPTTGGRIDAALELGTAPIAWLQTQELGGGWVARALTVIAPVSHEPPAQRALLVIDGSRSMELVGKQRVTSVVHAIGAALPLGTEIEAIVFDREARRVLGAWQPADPQTLARIEHAVADHVAQNGSDATGALALAHDVFADGHHAPTMVIAITDGVFGQAEPDELVRALGGTARELRVHAIVLDPGETRAHDAAALHAAIGAIGGAYVEASPDEQEELLATIDDWLRPAWLDVVAAGWQLPPELRAGGGLVRFEVSQRRARAVVEARGERTLQLAAATAPPAAIAQLALAAAADGDVPALLRAQLARTFGAVDARHRLAVLTTIGSVARERRTMIAGGGPFTRMVVIEDPYEPAAAPAGGHGGGATPASALDRTIVERLIKDQLEPRAYGCYEHALGHDANLAGTAWFQIHFARGEVTHVVLAGLGDGGFDACVLDAAYALTPPMPTLGVNVDDQTVANVPLQFTARDHHPLVIPGDADSSSPIDIDAVRGGVPRAPLHAPVRAVDASTPLGNLRP